MEAVVYLLGGMGVTVLCLSAFVFVSAARYYVSSDGGGSGRDPRYFVKRSGSDRRRRACHSFPFEINGLWVERDRRSGRERRLYSR